MKKIFVYFIKTEKCQVYFPILSGLQRAPAFSRVAPCVLAAAAETQVSYHSAF